MADLTELQSAGATKILGSDATGLEQTPVQSTSAGAIHVNRRDSTGAEQGVIANPVQTIEGIATGGVEGALVVGTTAVEVKVGASKLTNRVVATLYNNSARIWFWGYNNTVTIATGTPIDPDDHVAWEFAKGSTASIWVIAAAAGLDGRVTEGA